MIFTTLPLNQGEIMQLMIQHDFQERFPVHPGYLCHICVPLYQSQLNFNDCYTFFFAVHRQKMKRSK